MATKDLFEFRLSDETYVNAWEDEDTTYLTIAFVTLAIPTEIFEELLTKINQKYLNKVKEKTNVLVK